MENLCILPWIHLEADANGKAKPCCLYEENIGDLNTQSLSEVWHSKKLEKLRSDFLSGKKPSPCSKCWNLEDSGNVSKRINDLERFDHIKHRVNQEIKPPAYLDLKLGRVCNLKCRICNSRSSSKWVEDELKLYGEPLADNSVGYWIADNMPVWNELIEILPYIEFLDFSGGEPLLIKKHFDFLKIAIEKGYSKNISLHYNTNGTIMPTEKMFEIWSNFKYVEIMISADGIGKRFEYLRHPATWQKFVEIFTEFKSQPNLHVTICHSVNALNVYYLDEFIDWFEKHDITDDDLFLNVVHSPNYYNITNLPYSVKKEIAKKVVNKNAEKIINFMFSSSASNLDQLLEKTKQLDAIRNEDFSRCFYELHRLLLEYKKT